MLICSERLILTFREKIEKSPRTETPSKNRRRKAVRSVNLPPYWLLVPSLMGRSYANPTQTVTDWAPVIKMAASLVVSVVGRVVVLVWLFLLRCLLYYRFREFPDLLYNFYIKVIICLLKHHNSKFKLLCFEFSLCAGVDGRLSMVQPWCRVLSYFLCCRPFPESNKGKRRQLHVGYLN